MRNLQNGAFINSKNKSGRTALHAAARFGHIETVAALVRVGADATLRDITNNTPAYYAATNGHSECAELLKKAEEIKKPKY